MKFEVSEVKIVEMEDGFKYYGIFDKDNKDWYEELKKFDKDTLKVMYNKDTQLVLSTNTDASMIAPTMAGDVVEEIPFQAVEIAPDNYFVNGKIVKLKECETIKDGKIVFNRDFKIEQIKKELSELKTEHSEKEFIYKEKYLQRNRELDKNNLNNIVTMMIATKKSTFDGWKFKNKERTDEYVTLTMQDVLELSKIMTEQTTKAMHTETVLRENIVNLSDEELKNYNASEEFKKLWES
nr:MAG TPA: tail fiber assembly protein [Caudoviricetes sp.]